MKLRLTPQARSDLREIAQYYSTIDPQLARRMVELIRTRCRRLLDFPNAAQRVDPPRYGDLRRLIAGLYLIVYRVKGETVEVLRVVYGARDLDAILPHESSESDE